jgi:hypothetical protein
MQDESCNCSSCARSARDSAALPCTAAVRHRYLRHFKLLLFVISNGVDCAPNLTTIQRETDCTVCMSTPAGVGVGDTVELFMTAM